MQQSQEIRKIRKMSENTTDFKSTNFEIGCDIGGVRFNYRMEVVIDKEDIVDNQDLENQRNDKENVKYNQADRHTIKHIAGSQSVSFVRVL